MYQYQLNTLNHEQVKRGIACGSERLEGRSPVVILWLMSLLHPYRPCSDNEHKQSDIGP